MDTFQKYLHLAYPLIFILGGIGTLIIAAVGSPKHFEESKNPNMQRQIQKIGKTKSRILNAVGGVILLAVGLWLLHGWLFVKQP